MKEYPDVLKEVFKCLFGNSENKTNTKENPPKEIKWGSFDVAISNPPFGKKFKISDPKTLSQYETANKKSHPPEELFIERNYQFLKANGIFTLIVPENILNAVSLKDLR